MPTLQEIHGDDQCYICSKPKLGPGEWHCSYPHGLVPDEPVDPKHPNGMWTWKVPAVSTDSKD